MKKRIIALAIVFVMAFPMSVFAGIKAPTSEDIELNQSKTYKFAENEAEHFYHFTSSKDGYYEIQFKAYGRENPIALVVVDKEDKLIFGGFTYQNSAMYLKAGEYTIEIGDYYPLGNIRELTTTVKTHKHTYGKKIKSAARYYQYCNGNCGDEKLSFAVKPSITELTGNKKSILVNWTKSKTTGIEHQIQVSKKKSFKNAKTYETTTSIYNKTTINGLKAKKKYYVRIRAVDSYKDGTGAKHIIYSVWSKAKTVKTM